MKRIFYAISMLLMLALVGCNFSVPNLPGQDGGNVQATDVQTQIVQMLTNMPTNTPQPEEPTATAELATLPAEGQAPTVTPQVQVTDTPAPSNTPAATETATPLPTPTQTPVVQVPTASLTPTVTLNPAFTPAPGDPRARLGAPTSTDPMDNDRTWIWPTGSDTFSNAEFKNGAMWVTALSDLDGWRMANPLGQPFGNLYLEATFTTQTCAGSDHYGVIVRVPEVRTPDQGYLFGFTCDGRYSLRRWNGKVGTKGEMTWLVNWTASSAIATGSNQTNKMGIMMVGGQFVLYANGQLLTQVQDTSFSKGYFGVFVGADQTKITVLVDEMSYWENPTP